MKKGLSLSVALLMLLGCFASCAPATTPQEQPTEQETTMMDMENQETTVQETETETETETEAQTEETVPDTGYPVDLMTIGETAFSAFDLYVQPSAAKGITDAVALLVEYAEKATDELLKLI
jgi:apolipoprotein N-acyltransferase